MIRRIFHSWEHRLASATKNRVVRPFEWGADWLPPESANGSGAGEGLAHERAVVERYVEEVMRDQRVRDVYLGKRVVA